MSEKSDRERRRLVTLGEIIAIAALIVSAIGVWISWKNSDRPQGPTRVIEQRQAIPLTLKASARDDGRTLVIAPVEPSHALESLTLTIKGNQVQVGSDGELYSSQVESALGSSDKDARGAQSVPVRIETRYVEAGSDKRATRSYRLTYRWEGGGLFGSRSVRLVSLSRS